MSFANRRKLKKQQEQEAARIKNIVADMGYVKQKDIDDKEVQEKRKALWAALSNRERILVLRYVAKKKGVNNE